MLIMPAGWRQESLKRLSEPLDVLVIGGGITGAGILHDAARRGLAVGLVERGDFASGTSSRSSKLIHGGLRYLKRLQLGITRTASRERDLLLRHDPHLVWPLRFLYPAYDSDPTPGWQVSLGLTMYDHLSPVRHVHEKIDVSAVRALAPELTSAGMQFGLTYDDAAADDARLVLAVIAAGVLAGGTALNYAPVEALLPGRDGTVSGAVVRDLETGNVVEIAASVVVNATGVWCDAIRSMLGGVGGKLRPSRGSHVLFPRHRLPLDVAVTALSPDDGRPIFAVPHPEGTLVGTTDLFHDGALDDPRPDRAEVDYLLRFATTAFPTARLSADDVCGAFSGVRPIVDDDASSPSEASREEAIWIERGLVSTAGGKLTTYRATAAEVVDAAVGLLPENRRPRTQGDDLATVMLPWRASPDAVRGVLAALGVDDPVRSGLARRLGALAPLVADAASGRGLVPLVDGLDISGAELEWHARWGGVVHLEDLFLRRTRLGMWRPGEVERLATRLRPRLRRLLGWSFRRWGDEVDRLASAAANWAPPGRG